MTLISFPVAVDDLGDGISGTPVNAALLASLKGGIDTITHSTVNPTLTPRDIIDEVVTARGNLSSLDARLDGVVNSNGVLAAGGGLAIKTFGFGFSDVLINALAANTTGNYTFAVSGIEAGDMFLIMTGTVYLTAGLILMQWGIQAAGTVYVSFRNLSGAPITQTMRVYYLWLDLT